LLNLAPHKDAAYLLPAMPALYLLAGRGFSGMRSNALGSVALLALPLALFYTATHLSYFQAHEKWMDVMLQYSGETREAGQYLRQSMPDNGAVYSNHLWPVAAYYSKRPTIVLWPRDARFYRVFPSNMKENGYFIYYRGVGKQPEEDWMGQRPEFHKLKDFGSTVLYAYKYSGQGTITAEVRQRIDDAKAQFDAQAYEKVLDILAPVHFPDMEVSNLRGWSYYRIGMIEQAAAAFREGLLAEADNPRNSIGLAYSELRLGDPQSARQHFRSALNQVPDAVDAMVGLGLASMRLGDNVAAEEQFRNALRLDPKNEEIRGYLSRAQAP
jgi:tetratricopeptide (TPR) repeat protein